MATVSELWYYPVKGCAGTTLQRARVLETGIVDDRSFMFVRAEDGVFRSQRSTPRLSVVRPELVHDGAKLTLAAPDLPNVTVDVRTDGPRREVSVHGIWTGDGVDQGDDVAEWASGLVGERLRLVRVPSDHERKVDDDHGRVGFADSTALHLTSRSSLDDLNARILERGAEPVPMTRFRPNVVVAGWETPYTEDGLRAFRVGETRLRWVKPDVRCQVTMVDQATGERAGPEPLRTLADYRREPEGGVSFGIKVAVVEPGRVSVGDPVEVG